MKALHPLLFVVCGAFVSPAGAPAQSVGLPDPIRSVLSSAMPRPTELPGFKLFQHLSWAYRTSENVPRARVRFIASSDRLKLTIRLEEHPSVAGATKELASQGTSSPLGLPSGSFTGKVIGDACRHTQAQGEGPTHERLMLRAGRRMFDLSFDAMKEGVTITDSDRAMLEKLALSICERLKPLHHAEKASPSEYLRPPKPNKKP